MSDTFSPRHLTRDPLASLISKVRTDAFPTSLVDFVSQSAEIANFGAFYVADMERPAPVLSIWGGEMSSYWFNRNAKKILSNDWLINDTLDRIRKASNGALSIERWRPVAGDPRAEIYSRDGVIERVTVSSWVGRVGIMSFYLRGERSGWFTKREMDSLFQILPVIHELVGLRHHLMGSNPILRSSKERVTALRERDVGRFGTLSPREAEVCDRLSQGLSVSGTALDLGVKENTVRTLRRRAYAKLDINSATQIAALIMSVELGAT